MKNKKSFYNLILMLKSTFDEKIYTKTLEIGLTMGQPMILECLMQNNNIIQKDIAKYCKKKETTIGLILRGMEKSGLVQKEKCNNDKRCVYISITKKGKEKALKMKKIYEEVEKDIASCLDEEEKNDFENYLKRMINENLEVI
ncbi:MAG: MarR family transcriptional regulator [Peptoniphilaceae bacterium]|nr:MarR family transcriptional regulator [Peptoniphilaceae bacterium]MDD7383742.1 MarR family transcriptional regulator [Peptoniphilaceae bacterium]MDY3737858.1 MarR family transcriptional regulator [Peptoniphilaceae bacterium]